MHFSKMDAETWIRRKNNMNRRRFADVHLDVFDVLPADRLTFYLDGLREMSARRIQTAWRGYRTRRKFAEVRGERRREKAAVAIQRRVRHWLHTRAEAQNCISSRTVSKISEERLQKLQQEVSRWQDTHDNVKFPGMKQMVDLHFQVQNRLTSFYWRFNEGSIRQQRHEARCAQLEALCTLSELPALSQSENMDISWYHCPSLPFATAARLAHKRQLRSPSAVWWRKLMS
ncbi:uncharacterized protein LOC110840305 [Zootermopsis nevadensis]|uniref:IQ calmodulin-binding motif-containing protein 1 n=1 Tax=Zootermopsis nevadensis TaxID=136037 RepID=A0A067QIP0_ZOONE|nr:uncharacterized protein LOC110840305 [Zootermopsis nevadensis]KDR07168.1 IQ calmodulin-binding motif-containing protein 1 [Zootermopsis nevadensis]